MGETTLDTAKKNAKRPKGKKRGFLMGVIVTLWVFIGIAVLGGTALFVSIAN